VNWNRSLVALGAALPVVALLAWGMTVDPTTIPSPLPGREAPEFALALMPDDGMGMASFAVETESGADTIRLADFEGRVVVLNFWASWCLACRSEHSALSRVAAMYQDRGVQFFGVLYNDTPENGRRWIRQMGGQTYPSLLDPGSRTAIDYGLYGVPETFFIGRDGRVAYKQIGPSTEQFLISKLEELLAEPVEERS
jgi:cytochrome c biogenesis protein CcmG, thiol:disulfide interchange protein DsbE